MDLFGQLDQGVSSQTVSPFKLKCQVKRWKRWASGENAGVSSPPPPPPTHCPAASTDATGSLVKSIDFFQRPITPPSEISLTSSRQRGNSRTLITHHLQSLWTIPTVYPKPQPFSNSVSISIRLWPCTVLRHYWLSLLLSSSVLEVRGKQPAGAKTAENRVHERWFPHETVIDFVTHWSHLFPCQGNRMTGLFGHDTPALVSEGPWLTTSRWSINSEVGGLKLDLLT